MKTPNNISPENIEAAERYLNKEMNAAERLEFDTRLNDDAAFRTQFEETKAIILGIESASLKVELDKFHEEIGAEKSDKISDLNSENNSKSFIKKLIPYSIAASIILALGLFLYTNQTPTNAKLFGSHFTPDPGLPTKMGTTSDFEFYDAMVDYKRKEYDTAINKWEKLQQKDTQNDTLNYFIGVSYLAKGDAVNAEKYLENATKNSKGFLENDTYYYLGMAYLKADNSEKAKATFEKCGSEKCKKILAEMDLD